MSMRRGLARSGDKSYDGRPMRAVVIELLPEFESKNGHKVVTTSHRGTLASA